MADRTNPTYPPVGDDERFDAIVSRGRHLRRRRQLGLGAAGAGGAVAAAVLAVVVFTALPSSGGDPVIADQDDTATTTTVTTTTTTTAAPTTDGTTIQIDADQRPVRVVVADPVQPVATGTDPPAHQCVVATLTDAAGAPVGEATACRDATEPDAPVQVTLTPIGAGGAQIDPGGAQVDPGGAQIGCAATAERLDPVERTTVPATSTFLVGPPASLAAGTYTLTVEAVSGIGDGCPGPSSPESNEDEHEAVPATATVAVP